MKLKLSVVSVGPNILCHILLISQLKASLHRESYFLYFRHWYGNYDTGIVVNYNKTYALK